MYVNKIMRGKVKKQQEMGKRKLQGVYIPTTRKTKGADLAERVHLRCGYTRSTASCLGFGLHLTVSAKLAVFSEVEKMKQLPSSTLRNV